MHEATTAQPQKIAVILDHCGQSPTNHHFLLDRVCEDEDAEETPVARRASHFDVSLLGNLHHAFLYLDVRVCVCV
jgi:hypothetical protein